MNSLCVFSRCFRSYQTANLVLRTPGSVTFASLIGQGVINICGQSCHKFGQSPILQVQGIRIMVLIRGLNRRIAVSYVVDISQGGDIEAVTLKLCVC